MHYKNEKVAGQLQRWYCRLGLLLLSASLLGCGGSDIHRLISQLDNADEDIRYDALKQLDAFGPQAASAAEQLAVLLNDEHSGIRYRSAKLLSKIGVQSKVAVQSLATALHDPEPQVRYYAAKAIDQFAEESEQASLATDALINALADDQAKVRYYAAKSLGKLGTQARASLDRLAALTGDHDPQVRQAATSAIRRIKKSTM